MRHLLQVLAAGLVLGYVGVAQAHSGYLTTFDGKYGTSGTRLDTCDTCHVPGGKTRNPFGLDVQAQFYPATNVDAATLSAALTAVEPLDSDGDTYSNITEIRALTFPGDPNDKPVSTITYCPDADGDGYAVCNGTCTLPAGKQCGDCNDANAAVNPGVAEGPWNSAVCSDGLDNNCNGQVDAADPGCAVPAADYDITSLSAPSNALVRSTIQISVSYALKTASDVGARLKITGDINGTVVTIADQVIYGSATLTFPYKVTKVGTYNWTAEIIDGDPDVDIATASTTVTRK